MERSGRWWWPAPHTWAQRWSEYGRVLGWGAEREAFLYYLVPGLTVIMAVGQATGDLAAPVAWGVGLFVGNVAVVKALDPRLDERDEARSRWTDPEVLAAAARLGLHPPADPSFLLGRGRLLPLGARHALGSPRTTAGLLEGTLDGRRVVVEGRMTPRGTVQVSMIAITVLQRPRPHLQVRRRAIPKLLDRNAASEFEHQYVLKGAGASDLGPYVERWLMVQTANVTYTAEGDLLVVTLDAPDPDDPTEALDLAALAVAYAARLDGPRTRRPAP